MVRVNSYWEVFYSVLLWLSLVCMIPFDLDQFDQAHERGKTAEAIEEIAKRFLGRSGMEREGAALVLSRLFTRYVSRIPRSLSYSGPYPERMQGIAWMGLYVGEGRWS